MNVQHRTNDVARIDPVKIEPGILHRRYDKGQIIFNGKHDQDRAYRVTSGEVIIVCNGNMVDLIEAGEVLDTSLWHSAVGIAWKNCRLVGWS